MKVDPYETQKRLNTEYWKQEQTQKEAHYTRDDDKRTLYYQEVQSMKITVDGQELNNENDPSGLSRMYVAGEKNFKELITEREETNGKTEVVETITLVDGNDAVYCTQACINERVQEMATICAVSAPKNTRDISKLKKVNMKLVIHIGEECKFAKVYEEYAKDVKQMYNINVEILP